MAVTYQQWWGSVQRPWGHEVRVDYRDDATGAVYNEVLMFPAAPDDAALAAAIEARRQELDARLAGTPTTTIVCEDGTEVVL